MRKYCVHALFVVEQLSGMQEVFPIWENVYVVEAAGFDEAFEIGERVGRKVEEYTRDVYLGDLPALQRFRGIRRVVETDIFEGQELPVDEDGILEVTYTHYEVSGMVELNHLLEGEDAVVVYVGRGVETA